MKRLPDVLFGNRSCHNGRAAVQVRRSSPETRCFTRSIEDLAMGPEAGAR